MLFPHDTKVDALAKAPLFAALSRQELGELAKATEDLEVDEGKALTREGDLGREFFVIVEGDVSVTQDGKEIRRLGAGDFFGEIALIYDNARRTATVRAASPLRFFVLTRQSFRSLLEHQPEIEEKVMAALEERLAAG
ncbi:MAG TPA: cyclic nucleotide-binding domain-containing protein [Gaiellaceae bacterium]|nr:cyclic nucleotide-binding domain-containing protein [Gaiellaceae bacterium]